jgi:hypothetical protein
VLRTFPARLVNRDAEGYTDTVPLEILDTNENVVVTEYGMSVARRVE